MDAGPVTRQEAADMTTVQAGARGPNSSGQAARRKRPGACSQVLICSLFIYLLTALPGAQAMVRESDQNCLKCHSMPALKKTLGDGSKISLHIPPEPWSESVHSKLGCDVCHGDIDAESHPAKRSIASAREYSLEKSTVCRGCHSGNFKLYEGSIHASLVAQGDAAAPVCASCHNVHAQQKVDTYDPLSGEPCKNCHADIFQAYAGSMHGQARLGLGDIQAPICIDCHQAHDIQSATAEDRIKTACLGCHVQAQAAHEQWLPNSGIHLEMVACPACHSPQAARSVDLRLYDNEGLSQVTESSQDPKFENSVRAIDADGDGLNPRELRQVVNQANADGSESRVTLQGRLEVRDPIEVHQLALKPEAVRDCKTCHESGASPYQNVTVSVAAEHGRRIRYAADEEILNSATSVDSVGGFYTAGGTRIRILDWLVGLAILAGVAIPIIHLAVRKYFKGRR